VLDASLGAAARLARMISPPATRPILVALLGLALCTTGGCSFSASSESISNSISSPFTSSSASSKSDEERYEDDVADYAEAFAKGGGGELESFKRGLAGIAEDRGISDWEANPNTWSSIGAGLGRSDINDAAFSGYQESWAGGDSTRMELMQQGFDKAR